jgi:hypothetical protein
VSTGIQWASLNQQTTDTEAHKMTFGDGVAFAILGLTVLIWVNLQMMGVI